MSRSVLLLLLLLNGALALWAVGLQSVLPWPIPGQSEQEPDRVALQVRPEAIRLVGAPAPATVLAPESASSAVSASAPAAGASAASAAPAAPAPSAPTGAAPSVGATPSPGAAAPSVGAAPAVKP